MMNKLYKSNISELLLIMGLSNKRLEGDSLSVHVNEMLEILMLSDSEAVLIALMLKRLPEHSKAVVSAP